MTLLELVGDPERWEIDPCELRDLLDEREGAPFWLIDCREREEHVEWGLGGERWMPLSNFPAEVRERLPDPASGEAALPAIVYCHHGMRSLQATQFLRSKGHVQAYSLRGGIDAWARSGYPMEGERFGTTPNDDGE